MEALQEPGPAEMQEQLLRLTQERRELQDYAERVTRELRRYQQARPQPPATGEEDMPLPPWASNMQMMSPLLFSYEERISELEAVVERSASLAEQAQVLTKENDAMRAELQERTEQLRNAQLMAPFRDGKDGDDDIDEAQELYKLSVEQNEALAQQNQLLKVQVERMQQTFGATQQQAQQLQAHLQQCTQAHTQEQERIVKAFTEERENLAKALNEEQGRCETLARQRSAAEQRLEEVTADLVAEVRTRENLQGEVESQQQELHLKHQSLDFYKKSFEDRCDAAAEDEERLLADLDRAVRGERALRQHGADLERELAEVTDQFVASRREGDATKREAEQMLSLMESIEKRLRDISAKHDKAQQELTEREAQLGELQIQKDGWASTEQALRRQVERLEGRIAGELESLKRQREVEGEAAQHAHRRTVSELEEQLRRSEQTGAQLQIKVEMLERQKASQAAEIESKASDYSFVKERLQGDLDEMQADRLRLEQKAETHRKESARLREELDAAAARARDAAARAVADSSAAQAKIQSEERALRLVKEELRSCEAKVQDAASARHRLQSELLEERTRSRDFEAFGLERCRSTAPLSS